MAENLAGDLVRHRGIGLAAHMIAELRLDHGERRFDVEPLAR